MYPAQLGTRKVMTVASARGRYIMEYHIPKMPKKPDSPRHINSHLTSFGPKGKCGTFFQYMYRQLRRVVMLIRAKRSWKGCIPSPSNSSRRAARFINAPKSCAKK